MDAFCICVIEMPRYKYVTQAGNDDSRKRMRVHGIAECFEIKWIEKNNALFFLKKMNVFTNRQTRSLTFSESATFWSKLFAFGNWSKE